METEICGVLSSNPPIDMEGSCTVLSSSSIPGSEIFGRSCPGPETAIDGPAPHPFELFVMEIAGIPFLAGETSRDLVP